MNNIYQLGEINYEMQSPFVKDNDNFQDMQEIKSQNVSRF